MNINAQSLLELAGRFKLINEILKSEQIEDDIETLEYWAKQFEELDRVCEQQRKEIGYLINANNKLRKENENNSIE